MEINDPRAIRALAHPLRLDLLELLVTHGPLTAAQCGRRLDVPQANCSFHLRQLAKYGYVGEAGPGRDRRERQWQVTDRRPDLRLTGSGDQLLRRQLERVVLEREVRAVLDHTDTVAQESPEWQAGAGVLSALAVLTAEESAELRAKFKELLAPYLARAEQGELAPGRRHVRVFLATTPTRPHPTEENTA
ncbi:winged helix-turn-helix domain-containing protein [Kitasatospora sp. NPDC058965]|uniref:winged helix-turn-helix domain-containing protein n=1 Tax=Kitasatospora sp. NPDC058965 TaxID=3346682 RepID=UPI0036BF81FA